MSEIKTDTIEIELSGQRIPLAYFERPGDKDTLLYLHGLGSSKADFLSANGPDGLPGYSLVAFDFPGCGDSSYPDGATLGIDDLVETTRLFLDARGIDRVTLIGHSFGGLTGLLFAHRHPERVTRFINVEGNVASEDCGMFSRAVVARRSEGSPEYLMERFSAEFAASEKSGFDTYAKSFSDNVTGRAFVDYCVSIVRYSDDEPLLEYFTQLTVPRLFIYGAENALLSYIPRLAREGIRVEEIPDSNHFPTYSNPSLYYGAIRNFLGSTERVATGE